MTNVTKTGTHSYDNELLRKTSVQFAKSTGHLTSKDGQTQVCFFLKKTPKTYCCWFLSRVLQNRPNTLLKRSMKYDICYVYHFMLFCIVYSCASLRGRHKNQMGCFLEVMKYMQSIMLILRHIISQVNQAFVLKQTFKRGTSNLYNIYSIWIISFFPLLCSIYFAFCFILSWHLKHTIFYALNNEKYEPKWVFSSIAQPQVERL